MHNTSEARRAVLTALSSTSCPVAVAYRDWLEARADWCALANDPNDPDWKAPAIVEAQEREDAAAATMKALKPTSDEGLAAQIALAWAFLDPGNTDPDLYAERVQEETGLQIMMVVWKNLTGQDGYPVT